MKLSLRFVRPFPFLFAAVLMGCGSSSAPVSVKDSGLDFKSDIKKSGGDYSKLTPADQKMADDISHGHGANYVKNQFAGQGH